jgi:hypothetical protein
MLVSYVYSICNHKQLRQLKRLEILKKLVSCFVKQDIENIPSFGFNFTS